METDNGEVLTAKQGKELQKRMAQLEEENQKPAPRTYENQVIRKYILQIYSDYDNSPGAYKIRCVLERDYGISLGRVYRFV